MNWVSWILRRVAGVLLAADAFAETLKEGVGDPDLMEVEFRDYDPLLSQRDKTFARVRERVLQMQGERARLIQETIRQQEATALLRDRFDEHKRQTLSDF